MDVIVENIDPRTAEKLQLKDAERRIRQDFNRALIEIAGVTDTIQQWKLARHYINKWLDQKPNLWDHGRHLSGTTIVGDRRRRKARVWLLTRLYELYGIQLITAEPHQASRLNLYRGDLARYIAEETALEARRRRMWLLRSTVHYHHALYAHAGQAANRFTVAFRRLGRPELAVLYYLMGLAKRVSRFDPQQFAIVTNAIGAVQSHQLPLLSLFLGVLADKEPVERDYNVPESSHCEGALVALGAILGAKVLPEGSSSRNACSFLIKTNTIVHDHVTKLTTNDGTFTTMETNAPMAYGNDGTEAQLRQIFCDLMTVINIKDYLPSTGLGRLEKPFGLI